MCYVLTKLQNSNVCSIKSLMSIQCTSYSWNWTHSVQKWQSGWLYYRLSQVMQVCMYNKRIKYVYFCLCWLQWYTNQYTVLFMTFKYQSAVPVESGHLKCKCEFFTSMSAHYLTLFKAKIICHTRDRLFRHNFYISKSIICNLTHVHETGNKDDGKPSCKASVPSYHTSANFDLCLIQSPRKPIRHEIVLHKLWRCSQLTRVLHGAEFFLRS
jgi:hypothetical protein